MDQPHIKHVQYYEWVEINDAIAEAWSKDLQELWFDYLDGYNFSRGQLIKFSSTDIDDLRKDGNIKHLAMLERLFGEFGTETQWGEKEINIFMDW